MSRYLTFYYYVYGTEWCGGMNSFAGWVDDLKDANPVSQGYNYTHSDYIFEVVEHSSMNVVKKYRSIQYNGNTSWYELNDT